MDRPVESQFKVRKIVKRILLTSGTAAALVTLLAWGPAWIRPSVHRSRIRTAVVDIGTVEATITASGTVIPRYEQVISSPIESRVLRILKRPGETLSNGDPILELDVSSSQLELERLQKQLGLKENSQRQRRVELENTLIDLRGKMRLRELDLRSLELKTSQQRRLYSEGLTSESDLRTAEVLEEKAKTELLQLKEAIGNAGRSTQAQLEGLALEIDTLRKESMEVQRLLQLATTTADRDGVLTWVVEQEGTAVRKGDIIARVADLKSFRVEATVSDVHASRLSAGLTVRIKANEEVTLEGVVANVLPAIKDGIVTLTVDLEESSHSSLRSNLRVDVFVITGRKGRTLRLKRGPFFNGEGQQDVFVIRSDVALRTPVNLGMSSFENIEVRDGLAQGDEVIISQMTEYLHMEEVPVRR